MKTATLPDGLVWSPCPICGHRGSAAAACAIHAATYLHVGHELLVIASKPS